MVEPNFHKQKTLPGWPQDQPVEKAFNLSPKMIGPYRIECLLEEGGMSYLFLGIHPETNELTTIKVLSPRFLSHPEAVERFINESEIIAMTDHPNIVKLFGHGEWEGGLYIAMEYIQGNSLRQTLLQNPLSLKRALEIVIDIAYALCHLHTHGVIHRDLKPENILITENDQVKVIDFGISQLLTEKSTPGSPSRQRLMGTPIYMSPEQRENPETVSYPSDIYSLGIIAYELILGKLSHGQIHLSLMPKGIHKILSKTLQHDPKDRYQDIVDFITDVSAYMHSTSLQKEKQVGDHLSELSENLRHVQGLLSSQKPTSWKDVDIGIAIYKGTDLPAVYDDFLDIGQGKYVVIHGESSAKDAEGIVYISMLRGMIHSLQDTLNSPIEIAEKLNKLLVAEQSEHVFTLNYLLLLPNEKQVQYIFCGRGYLWRIPGNIPERITGDASTSAPTILEWIDSRNVALGIAAGATFSETNVKWENGDCLFFCSDTPDTFDDKTGASTFETLVQNTIEGNKNSPSQFILDSLLRKIKMAASRHASTKTCTFICFKNTAKDH